MKLRLPTRLVQALLTTCAAALTSTTSAFADIPEDYTPVIITDVDQLANYTKSDYIAFILSADITDSTYGMTGAHQYWTDDALHTRVLTFEGIESASDGGALSISSVFTAEHLQELSFSQNVSTSSEGGGAIYGGSSSTITLNDNGSVTFSGNSGGAISAEGTFNLTCNGSVTFSENSGSFGGGAISADILNLTGNDTVTFSGNTAKSGGALYGINNTITLSNNGSVTFSANSASYYDGGAIYAFNTHVNITSNGSVTFSANSASSYRGGAIYADNTDVNITSNGSVAFSGNTGGAISAQSTYVDFTNTHVNITNNDSVTFSENSGSQGGAIYASSGSIVNLTGNETVTFRGNHSGSTGGAISTGFFASSGSIVNLTCNGSVTFSENSDSSSEGGGAIYGGSSSTITLNDNDTVTFSGNSASSGRGGAFSGESSTISLMGNETVTFSGNSASSRRGGAIYGESSTISLMGNDTVTFSGNAAYEGGAIYASSGSIVNLTGNGHVVFQGNYEQSGSGDRATYRLRSVCLSSSNLYLSTGANQDIVFYDALYASSASTVSFNAKYVNKEGVEQEATGDIVFSGKYAEEDLKRLKADYTPKELTNSLTSTVYTTTNLYGGRLRIEDGAIYQGYGINVAGGSHATLCLANGTLNHAGYNVSLASGTTLDLQGENKITANTLDMQDGSTLSFTIDAADANTAILTMQGTFNQDGTMDIFLNANGSLQNGAKYLLISLSNQATPTSWNPDLITVSGLEAWVDNLSWTNGNLYFTYVDIPPLQTAIWGASESMVWNTRDKNWTQGEYTYRYRAGVDVVFGDVGSGSVTLDGVLAPKSVLVENSSNHDYTFTGDGKLTGGMQLTKEGDGTLTISTANDYTGGTVINGGVVVVDNATALGSGDVALNGAELDISTDAAISGQITVNGESMLSVDGGHTLALGSIIIDNSYLEMRGRYDISAITGTETGSSYVGGETQGNGLLQTGYEMMLIVCGLSGDFDWSEAEIYHSGNKVTKADWGGVTYAIADVSTFYIFNGAESVSTVHSLDANTNIQMSRGTTLKVDEDISLSRIQASGSATINIDSGKELSGYTSSMNLTLAGTGVYALDSRISLGSIALGNDWTGTVQLMGSASSVNFNSMARTDSWLELKGFSGYPTTYNGTTTANIILNDKEDGTAAFTATYGYSYDYGYTMKFTGAIKGEGTFVANAGSNRYENYEFAGDISGWTGEFRYVSGRNTKLTISGNANVVNAAIDGASGLTLCLNTSATFNEAVDVNGLALDNGSATFNDALHVNGSITASGTSALVMGEGQTLSLGAAIANSGNLTLSGTFDVSGRESVLIGSEYSGGEISGNGFGLTLYGVQVVQNSGSATLDWSSAEIVYDTPGFEKRADGAIVQGVNDGMFHVQTGTERVSTAQNAAEEAGITMQGVELNNGTTLIVDKEFSIAHVSLVSGSAVLNVETGVTLLSDGADHTRLSLSGNGMYKLAAGSSSPNIDWSGNDWHGTVMLTDAAKQDWNLNDFGHAGSKVGLDGVSGNFARPNVCGEIVPTLVLVGDGLTVTACYTNATYTFSGGVEGDGNWTYGLTGKPHNQTYIFTGDVSNWTGAYESIVDGKTSTLQFQEDAVEMGAAIKQTAGIINVEVGDGLNEHTTTFMNEVEAASFTVKENATAAFGGAGRLNVGDAYSIGVNQGYTRTDFRGLEMTEEGITGTGVTAARIDHAIVDLQAEASVVFDNVVLGATSRLTDDPATVVANNMVIEGQYGVNVEEGAPMTIKSGSIMQRLGEPSELIELDSDASACRLDITNVDNVSITGNCLTIDLSGMYPALLAYSQKYDWLGISLGSGDQVAMLDTNMVVELKLNDRLHPRAYYTSGVGWGGADFVMPVVNGENVGIIYINMFDVPEPTTSTLSLLALAALAARRKRK